MLKKKIKHVDIRTIFGLTMLLFFFVWGCSRGTDTPLKIGDVAPDFLVEGLDGRPFQLSGYAGNPVVIRFFVTDCKFCKADTSTFNQYYQEHKEDGLKILYLTTTVDQAQVKKFVEDLAIPFPVSIDFGRKVSDLYNVHIVPQALVLDQDHRIKAAILGGVTSEELDEVLGHYWQKNEH
ncbi:MAG: redoxin domain-containing protein [Proteobacteria bacterium]|nr:redoxin domain-containing protein [Pseudomonadota bacterium]MBU1686611.1 redoxin domain-containing protein [Pseudomonadota bacterium]